MYARFLAICFHSESHLSSFYSYLYDSVAANMFRIELLLKFASMCETLVAEVYVD